MRTQDYLRQIEKFDAVIRNKQERIEYLRMSLMGQGIDYSSEKVKTSPRDRLSSTVSEYLDEEMKISQLLKDYTHKRNEIIEEMEQLETNHYMVLYLRYAKHKPFKEIMGEMGIAEQTVFKYHRQALGEFENKFGKKYLKK